ncbi:MAG TPA: FAD-dependent oxidoreductase [Thermoanaerobaculia bacterium]|nr:FAD-dependent oxidoreductase [Thermoanaerobaculia bacterium]
MAPLELTRRDVLAAFLGSAVACGVRRHELPPGTLVGASHEFGHRLRGAAGFSPPEKWESHDIVIAGGGVAGLAAAWRLDHRDAIVLELEPSLGGTSRSGAAFPWGAHYIIAPSPENRVLARLLEEMGVMHRGEIGEEFLVRDPEERLFYRGRWYDGLYLHAGASAEDERQRRAFEAEMSKWRERRAFTIPVAYCSSDADALDGLSMAEWMNARGFTSPRLRWFVEYACRDDYGSLLADTSAWAAIFYFASRDDRPVITWPEGNGRLVSHLARRARVQTNSLVTRITPTDAGADVIVLRGEETIGIHARHVIFAAPQFLARHVIPSRATSPEFTYGSWMVANLFLRDRPGPLAWDNVLYDSPSLGYVTATHQRGLDHGPTVLTYYYPICDPDVRRGREKLLAAGRDDWADVALTDLSRAHPNLRVLTDRIDIMRWGHAMVRPRPGFVRSAARRAAAQPFRTIHFANTDLSAVPLFEEALYHGVRAAEEVLEGEGGGTWL